MHERIFLANPHLRHRLAHLFHPTAMKDIVIEAKPVPWPETPGQKMKVARRQTQRLHMLRTQGYFLSWRDNFERPKTCVGCGGELSGFTKGCKPCSDRHGKRRKRAMIDNRDPQLLGELLLNNKKPDESLSECYDRLHESPDLQDFSILHASEQSEDGRVA